MLPGVAVHLIGYGCGMGPMPGDQPQTPTGLGASTSAAKALFSSTGIPEGLAHHAAHLFGGMDPAILCVHVLWTAWDAIPSTTKS